MFCMEASILAQRDCRDSFGCFLMEKSVSYALNRAPGFLDMWTSRRVVQILIGSLRMPWKWDFWSGSTERKSSPAAFCARLCHFRRDSCSVGGGEGSSLATSIHSSLDIS